ncbi:insulinase family protein [Deinococcus sp. HMF7604]|uniref:insulinase family protein n=1 Tax=Deinococcus betulae TaxID=2873312 RepID=UPI001CCD42A5|nr:insulinase family protein [Deinococcus betulae]MBZ9750971.1 insulinase family protein [Deinococcus betulae]
MTMTLPAPPRVGERLGCYTVQRVEPLPEMSGTLVLLTHDLGARHAHVIRADDNTTFGVTFPTVPRDSTGVAHILEHVVLMGSQRFPVPDPFFSMIPRSLNTFMNAMTASDWTTYPFSTRNEKDFFNLLSVYLDAAFFPLMRYESFRQDGHRFEFETPDDPTTPLKMQGVVYNEMKGAMASPSSVMWRAFGKALYPDLTYANNSGGAPGDIPGLTYDALRAFHAAHYHPGNAFFYTYGALSLERILAEIEAHVMSRFSPQVLDVSIPDQTPFSAPQREAVRYPSSDTERGAQVLVGWKLGHSSDPHLNLRWSVLSDVLLGNPAAPLTRPLIESGLGSALSDLSGYRDSFREGAFAAGLKGLPAGKAAEVETLVLDTLREIAGAGLDPELISSSLHQFEIMQKEVSNSGQPYGLQVMFRLLGPWLHGGDPVTGLRLDDALDALRADLAAGPVFEPLLRALLDNPHRVTLELVPDPALAAQVEADEAAMVARLSADFTPEDRARILADSARLKEVQGQPSDPNILPTLTLADVPAQVPAAPYITQREAHVQVARAPQPTGGLTYLDLRLRLPALPDDLLDALPLYTYALTRSGAAGQDYAELARRIEAVTGGVSASVGVGNPPDDVDALRLAVTVSGKALSRNAPELVGVLRDLLVAPEFTRERLEQLLKQRLAGFKANVVSSGNVYAERLATAQVSLSGALSERFGGLSALATLQRTVEEDGLETLLLQFARLQALLLSSEALLTVTATEADLGLDVSALTEPLTGSAPVGRPAPALAPRQPQARTTDTPVSYNALAWPTVPYTHPDSPALLVLSRLLRGEYLLSEIREKGGAYGGGASFEPRTGLFAMSSYRDPHIARTFGVFAAARDFLNTELGDRELTEAILSASKVLDPLTSPDTAGSARVFSDSAGYTPDVQAAYKASLLAVTLADLRRVMAAWLTPERAAYGVVTGRDPNEDTGVQDLGLTFDVQSI